MATVAEMTPGQRRVYEFIEKFVRDQGMSPSMQEIAAALGIVSRNGVVMHLRPLEEKGYITRVGRKARSIRLTGAKVCPHCAGTGLANGEKGE